MARVTALAMTFLLLSVMSATASTVRVAHPAQLAPFIFVKDGKTTGLVADILRAAAAREGIDIAFVPESPAQLRRTLSDGTTVAIAPAPIGLGPYDFTTPFLVTGGGLFVRAPCPAPHGLAIFSGKIVITPKDGPFVNFIRQNFPNVQVIATHGSSMMTNEYTESLDSVISGKADAAALNIQEGARVVAAAYAGKITVPTTMFTKLSLGLAVIKGQHADLLKRFDIGLAAIRADGTFQRIEERWNDR
jgi:polar amino acid transport system substrate-binding protein